MKINAAIRLTAALTSGTIEKAVKKKFGLEVKLYKGKGYYYFADPEGRSTELTGWPDTSVHVTKLSEFSLDQWMEAFKSLKDEADPELQHRKNEERYGKKK